MLLLTSLLFCNLLCPLAEIVGEPSPYTPGNSWTSRYDCVYVYNPLFQIFTELDEELEMIPIGEYYLTSKQKMLKRLLPFARAIASSFEDHFKTFILVFEDYSAHPTKEKILKLRKQLDELSYESFTEISNQGTFADPFDFGMAYKEALDEFTFHLKEAYAANTPAALKDLKEHGELLCSLVDDIRFSPCVEAAIEVFDEAFLDFQTYPIDVHFQTVLKAVETLQADLHHHHINK